MYKAIRLAALFLPLALPLHAAEIEVPEGTLIEAESIKDAAQYAKVVDDAAASGGKVVTTSEAYHPLFRSEIPAGTPDKVEVMVRVQGGPIQLKAKVDGQTKELQWLWDQPTEYTWVSFGVYDKAQLGSQIEIIRADGDNATKLDAVVLKPVAAGEPKSTDTPQNAGDAGIKPEATGYTAGIPPAQPSPDTLPVDLKVDLNWDANRGTLTDAHWGVALFHPVDGKAADDQPYVDFLARVQPGWVRIHKAGLGSMWMNKDKRSFADGQPIWDAAMIERALRPVRKLREAGVEAKLMICLSDWPTWLSSSKRIEPTNYDQAAEAVRQLVQAAADTGVRVDAWELLNEADNAYEKAGELPALWDLFNVMADAARQADPAAKIGGPALTWAKPAWVEPFLDACGKNIDFISWHNYAGGEPTVPNETLFAQVPTIASHAAFVRGALKQRGLEDVETYLTEFNVQWTWQPFERRHANNVGAAFLASAVTALAEQGITGITMWHAKGNAYGLIDNDNRLRATGALYALSPRLTGRMGSATLSPELAAGDIRIVPLIAADGRRTLLLINQGQATARLSGLGDWPYRLRVDYDGLLAEQPEAGPVELPGWSVTVLAQDMVGFAPGLTALPGQHVSFNW